MGSIQLKSVTKSFGPVNVITGVDLSIQNGEFAVFVGPSGCGKSTLLRLIAGLEDVTSGQVIIDGKDVTEIGPSKRGLAMVFQSYALYPHMSVRGNIAFALKMAGQRADVIEQKVRKAAATLNLTDYLDRKPRQLSGGQRQRVAIGRAIVREPEAFLFDEPLSNLDAALRVQMRVEIGELHNALKTTMIYVTHDQVEATTTADTIVVLRDGVVEQSISPAGREIRWQANGRALRQFRTLRGKRQRYPWENLFIPPNACARPQAAFSILPLKIRDRQLVETGTLHSTVAEHARERCSRLSTSSGPGAEKAASGNRWVEPAEAPVLDLTACGREDVLTS
jgi:ABC-type sulfate/molybdate transport systems ATPase subunit